MNKTQLSTDLQTVLTQAAQLLSVDPVQADAQATALLELPADSTSARHIKSAALRLQGKVGDPLNVIAIRLRPQTGEAYWSLADLKTLRFTDEDISDMQAQIDEEAGDPDDQSHLLFALGKAMEDRKRYDESFDYYARGNAIRSKHHRYSGKINVFDTVRQMKTLNAAFFEERKSWGSEAPDPIFIVGLPRTGSALLEQILASHSRVEGTSELPDIIAISRRLGKKSRKNPASDYAEIPETLSADRARELGERYPID